MTHEERDQQGRAKPHVRHVYLPGENIDFCDLIREPYPLSSEFGFCVQSLTSCACHHKEPKPEVDVSFAIAISFSFNKFK